MVIRDPVAEEDSDKDAGEVPVSCQAGIDGRPANPGRGVEDVLASAPPPRPSKSVFNDLSSCCRSDNDCLCASLFLSII